VLIEALSHDAQLAPRFKDARLIEPPHVMGPMALDARAPGVPGLLFAGDASGFIDPMTGDGLRFALLGAELAATVTLDVLSGRIDSRDAVSRLGHARHHAFAAKWRFNRMLRTLVASAAALRVTAASAALMPFAFEALIRYAGDCNDGSRPSTLLGTTLSASKGRRFFGEQ
jgi:flavin-dependent dehydrogenase